MKHNLFKSISVKISIIFSLSTIFILIIMGLFVNKLVMNHFDYQDRTLLEGEIQRIEHLLQKDNLDLEYLNAYLTDAMVGHKDIFLQIERKQGDILFSSSYHPVKMQQSAQVTKGDWIKWVNDNKQYHGLVSSTYINNSTNQEPVSIIVGVDNNIHQHFLNHFKYQLFLIGLAGSLCLMLLGWFAVRQGLKPVQSMTEVAKGISAQNLSQRLVVKNIPTELQPLAIAFNDMLDRLEIALEKLSDFSSDLAHEFRTPINNLLTQTQVCLARNRDIETYQEILFSNLEEFERLARMVSDMLFLAKVEHGLNLQNLQMIELSKEVEALFEFYDAVAAEKNMTLVQEGSGNVWGQSDLLRRALSNLLSNAVKYGKHNSIVQVKIQQNANTTMFKIENEADEIPKEQLARLFDRFYRIDGSRQRKEEGSGLGLAITKSILDMLGASINAESVNGKITFTIIFTNP